MEDGLLLNNKKGQNALLSFGFEHDPSDKEVFLLRITKERFIQIKKAIY